MLNSLGWPVRTRDDAVEFAAFVVQRFASGTDAFLARAQRAEVLGGQRAGLAVQLHLNAARGGIPWRPRGRKTRLRAGGAFRTKH